MSAHTHTHTHTCYQSLQGVDKVLQVHIVPVGLDVVEEEVVDPVAHLTLEHHDEHHRRQLQEEDEADQPGELENTRRTAPSPTTHNHHQH